MAWMLLTPRRMDATMQAVERAVHRWLRGVRRRVGGNARAQAGHVEEAASVPVVACTAWQMVFDHAQTDHTKRVLVHGGAGNVGSYAVQLAKRGFEAGELTTNVGEVLPLADARTAHEMLAGKSQKRGKIVLTSRD
jgi:NADPH:quinone reductase-like Zn-dependent oxidoreductase